MQFRLLDGGSAWVEGLPRQLRAGMPRAILAVLLLEANRLVSAERLIAALWGEHPPKSAGASLYNHIARLRRAMGGHGISRIRSVSSGYVIEVNDGELDLQCFHDLYRRGRELLAEQDWAGAAEALTEALALWRAEPLTDTPATPFFETEMRRLAELRLHATRSRIEADFNLGRHESLIPELTALVVAHPLTEVFHGYLMLALYRSGRPSDSLRAYQRVRALLREELGVDPGPELTALHHQILNHDVGLAHGPITDDQRRPPYVDRGASGAPAQLPYDLIDFTGRDAEVGRLRAQLAPPARPGAVLISAVTGTTGVGKTALAVHVAHSVAAEYPDGQLYASLGGSDSMPRRADDVLASFLRELGVPDTEQPRDQAAKAARYRTLLNGSRVLVVLDDAAGVDQVLPLLPGSAGCAVLITSRNRLPCLPGATHEDLVVLDDVDSHRMLTRIAGVDRVRADPVATAAVVRYADGLPLALRIAAARLHNRPAWTMTTLANRMADENRRLDEFSVAGIALRTGFDAAYAQLRRTDLVGVDMAAAFRGLAFTPEPAFDLRQAAIVLGERWPDTLVERIIDHLVDAHLIEAHEDGRYRFPTLLRGYARERAAELELLCESKVARSNVALSDVALSDVGLSDVALLD